MFYLYLINLNTLDSNVNSNDEIRAANKGNYIVKYKDKVNVFCVYFYLI